MNNNIRIEISFFDEKNRKLRIVDVLEYVEKESRLNPDREYYMDGDEYAIVSKPRKVTA